MDITQAIVLALIQGVTEFLPVSSSGHLVLPAVLLGWSDQGLAFDVAVHVGSLLAVMIYFRRDVIVLIAAWTYSSFRGQHTAESKLAWCVLLGTIPAGLAGMMFGDWIEQNLRTAIVLAATTGLFGVLLGWVDWRFKGAADIGDVSWRSALLIGLAQALALVPGTSRSGITITAALMLGFSRLAAARFSFLLSIPLIAAAGSLKLLELVESGPDVDWLPIMTGVTVSAASAWLCIHVFLKLVERVGLLPFAIYRVVLALVIMVLAV